MPVQSADGFRVWLKDLVRPGRRGRTIFNALGIVGMCLTSYDLVARFSGWAVRTEGGRFEVFLWVAFVVMLLMTIAWMVLDEALRRDLREIQAKVELGRLAAEVQHEMAEAVRRCAAGPRSYDMVDNLRRVMTMLTVYLRKRLGEGEYAITVKRTPAGSGRLIKVFRDGSQKLDHRSAWDDLPLEQSPIYMRFSRAPRAKRIVFISDTERVPVLEDAFRDRARLCAYRTVIGFPLRLPVALDPPGGPGGHDEVKFANLFGFFSIDAKRVGAFDGLLVASPGRAEPRDDDREPRNDLDVFYGIADSLATIVMLTSAAGNGEDKR